MLQEERDFLILDRNARYFHPDYPVLSAQIDSYMEIRALFRGRRMHGETSRSIRAPDTTGGEAARRKCRLTILAQVMFGLAGTNRKEATVAALLGDDLRVYLFERDDALCDELIARAVAFWNDYVLPRKPPPITTKEDAASLIRKFSGLTIEANDDLLRAGASCSR